MALASVHPMKLIVLKQYHSECEPDVRICGCGNMHNGRRLRPRECESNERCKSELNLCNPAMTRKQLVRLLSALQRAIRAAALRVAESKGAVPTYWRVIGGHLATRLRTAPGTTTPPDPIDS